MFCRYCGSELSEDAKFCNNCGKAVDAKRQEQKIAPEPAQVSPPKADPAVTAYTSNKTSRKTGSKKVVVVAIIVLVAAIAGVFGVRAVNEKAMKQQVPQSIYEDSREMVVAHYDKTMAYPYGSDLGYVYGCHFATFEFTKGDKPNIFHVDGELEVEDKSQEGRPSYSIMVHGTVTTNFFRSEWSVEWDLSYQDPVYETVSYSETSTPAILVNRFREQLTNYNGEYIEPHVPSESGGFTEGSGHVEVTINLEATGDNRMDVNITVFSFSDSARIAEVSANGEVEIQPALTIEFDDDGWGNKGILHLLFLENGEIGVWSEITAYGEYANWGLDIEYVELAKTPK